MANSNEEKIDLVENLGLLIPNEVFRTAVQNELKNPHGSDDLAYAMRGHDGQYHLYRNDSELLRYLAWAGVASYFASPLALGKAFLDGLGLLEKIRASRISIKKEEYLIWVRIKQSGKQGISKHDLSEGYLGQPYTANEFSSAFEALEQKNLIKSIGFDSWVTAEGY